MTGILRESLAGIAGSNIEPLEREQRLYERVVDKVLDLITTNTWKPGFRLPSERELAEAFGVSRTVVREAIKALQALGVVESAIGSGVFVRGADSSVVARSLQTYIQLSDQKDVAIRLNEVRRVLEVEVAALAAERATPEQHAQLWAICAEMRAGGKTAGEMAALDFRLHTTLADTTQNELFKLLVAPLIDLLRDHITFTWEGFSRPFDNVFEQHEAIVAAVEKGDADGARRAMLKHIAFSRGVVEESTRKRAEP